MAFKDERRSLLSSQSLVQVPWIRVDIGKYSFGVYSRTDSTKTDKYGFYTAANIKYPNFVKDLTIVKINGQVNQYTLTMAYGVGVSDDPNFLDKVFSSVSSTRKIVFSYGDMSQPNYVYRNEEALITKIKSKFNIQTGVITYTVSAVSSAAISLAQSMTFAGGTFKPSAKIKEIMSNPKYGLHSVFTGMNESNLDKLIAGDDRQVYIATKTNISPVDYITYLVSCMVPDSYTRNDTTGSAIYVLTLHDAASYDNNILKDMEMTGTYFRVQKVEHGMAHTDAFEIDIGVGNGSKTIVTNFDVVDDENYALLYDFKNPKDEVNYVYRLDNNGQLIPEWAPAITSKNDFFMTRPSDIAWWTKVTQYPIKATITLQGLLRPAILMSYIRINVIFPGGHKHIASGLYLVTSQQDQIAAEGGYKTTLALTKISGDNTMQLT